MGLNCEIKDFVIGVDVGGTFTDVVVAGPHGTLVVKAGSTPWDQSEGVVAGLVDAAGRLGLTLRALLEGTARVVHGTTVATNALLEGKGARVGMLVTEGHRDVLEMREGLKPARYDLRMPAPADIVPRALRVPVRERMRWDGSVAVPLDASSLAAGIEVLAAAGVESVAVCFLHAWCNPAHELAAAAAAQARMPGVVVTCSASVLAEIKEFERFSTAVATALVAPLVGRYLRRLELRLGEEGLGGPLFVMLSHGGVATVGDAVRLAAGTALSGPAGGVAAGVAFSAVGAGERLITFDMGGTSTDIAVVQEGRAGVGPGRVVGPVRIALPSLDIVTLAAGGGSIAAVGADGLLRVGPESAGARPGPACYGRGGTQATVTDANLVLGYLDAGGGGLVLDRGAAEAALERLAETLGVEVLAAAAGVHRVVTARMADGVRVATVQRGVDPRGFALLAFGGAAGLHAAAVAAGLGIGRVLVPWQASALSAWGMLNTDVVVQSSRGMAQQGGVDCAALAAAYAAMEREGAARLEWYEGELEFRRSADMRYGEQVFEIAVDLDGIALVGGEGRAGVEARFHAAHEALFTYAMPEQEVVLTTARLSVSGALPRLAPGMDGAAAEGSVGRRSIYIEGWEAAPVFGFGGWGDGWLDGPALIVSETTTVLVRPGDRARIDARGWVEILVG